MLFAYEDSFVIMHPHILQKDGGLSFLVTGLIFFVLFGETEFQYFAEHDLEQKYFPFIFFLLSDIGL